MRSPTAMIVEAGVTLAEAQAAAERADRLFPLSLASEGSCTIGGNLSTNAGGVAVLAYGNARELTTGVEVVLADGRIVNALSKLRKDNTGYDLKDLFVGAEGTLGIITAAALKLFARPRARETAFVGLREPRARRWRCSAARARPSAPAVVSFELIPRIALDFVLRHAPGARDPLGGAASLVRAGRDRLAGRRRARRRASPNGSARAAEAGLIDDAALGAERRAARRASGRLRESISEVQKFEGGSIKHDVSVPIGAVPEFLAEASAAVIARMPGARVVAFGHMGDGNIHFNVSQPVGADKAAFLAEWEAHERGRSRHRRHISRLVLRRARHRPAEARAAGAQERPGGARRHAPDQGGARPARDDESRQGAVTPGADRKARVGGNFAVATRSLPGMFAEARIGGASSRSTSVRRELHASARRELRVKPARQWRCDQSKLCVGANILAAVQQRRYIDRSMGRRSRRRSEAGTR